MHCYLFQLNLKYLKFQTEGKICQQNLVNLEKKKGLDNFPVGEINSTLSYLPRPLLDPLAPGSLVIGIYCIFCDFFETVDHDFFNLNQPLLYHSL